MYGRTLTALSYAAKPCPLRPGDVLELPFILALVPAGFPSPAEDYLEESLDIGAYLVKRKKTTFFMRVDGDSMEGAGINDGDLLVIDRAERCGDGSIVMARIGDSFTVKRLRIIDGQAWLYPENEAYQPTPITEGDDFEVWGRVTHSITSHGKPGTAGVEKVR